MVLQFTLWESSWTLDAVVGVSSFWWTGRVMVQRRGVGFPPGTFWIRPWLRTSVGDEASPSWVCQVALLAGGGTVMTSVWSAGCGVCVCVLSLVHVCCWDGFCFDSLPCVHCLHDSPSWSHLLIKLPSHLWLVNQSILPLFKAPSCVVLCLTVVVWTCYTLLVTNFQSCRVLFCCVFLGSQFSVFSLPSHLPHVSPALCFLSSCPGAPGAVFCGFTPAPLCALKKGASNSDVASSLTLCIVHSPLWRCVGSDVWTVVADLPTPYPLCLVEWLGAWLDWSPVPVYFLCLELWPPALLTGRVLCSETLINIWVEPAIESVFFPDTIIQDIIRSEM